MCEGGSKKILNLKILPCRDAPPPHFEIPRSATAINTLPIKLKHTVHVSVHSHMFCKILWFYKQPLFNDHIWLSSQLSFIFNLHDISHMILYCAFSNAHTYQPVSSYTPLLFSSDNMLYTRPRIWNFFVASSLFLADTRSGWTFSDTLW